MLSDSLAAQQLVEPGQGIVPGALIDAVRLVK
jgi:hypothetical protein